MTTAGLAAIETFVFPAVARADPALLDFDGPIAGTPAFLILGGLAVPWLLREALLGVAVARVGAASTSSRSRSRAEMR